MSPAKTNHHENQVNISRVGQAWQCPCKMMGLGVKNTVLFFRRSIMLGSLLETTFSQGLRLKSMEKRRASPASKSYLFYKTKGLSLKDGV